jgi:hypothetical protein
MLMMGCFGAVTLLSGVVRAQSEPLGPRPGFWPMMRSGPFMFHFMGSTVTGAPFSAEVTSEHSQALPDGNLIDQKSSAMVYRDGQGRTRLEETHPTKSGKAQQIITINDPIAGFGYVLDPAKKTARKFALPPTRSGNFQQTHRAGSTPNVSSQSLGSKTLDGLFVQGTQTTRKIPAGQMGNTAEIQISTTQWYSTDLSIATLTETTDPLHGNSTTAFTNISRDEPASTLFQVPSDYTVVNLGPRGRQRFTHPAPAQQ